MAKKKVEHSDLLQGIDEANRRIYFGVGLDKNDEDMTSFDSNAVEYAIRYINKFAKENPKRPIEIWMNSGGGDTNQMFYLYDVIQSCPCQIKFVGGGMIHSAAAFIMAACDERLLFPNASVMTHDGISAIPEGSPVDIKIEYEEYMAMIRKSNQIFADNSRMPVSFWEDVHQRDVHLTAEECIMLGIADKIIPPVKRGNLRKSRTAIHSKKVDPKEMRTLIKNIYDRTGKKKPTSKIEIIIGEPKKEQFDPNIIVDDSPIKEELKKEKGPKEEPLNSERNGEDIKESLFQTSSDVAAPSKVEIE